MNIIFFGSSHFGIPCLKALAGTGRKISCVVTQPDKKRGRGLAVGTTLIKSVAQELGVMVYQPVNVNHSDSVHYLRNLNPDVFVIVAYGQIVSQEILDIPRCMPVNVHASFLPKYRGAAPINWALINGDTSSGISIIKVILKTDAGPLLSRKEITIDKEDTALTLEEKLSQEAPHLLLEALEQIQQGNVTLVPQDEEKVILAPKLKKIDGLIQWEKSSQEIVNLIRGCVGWPGTYTQCKGKMLKVISAQVCTPEHEFSEVREASPGEILHISKRGILVRTGDGCVIIERLQVEGKRIMHVEEFIAGHAISVGHILGKK